MAFTTDIDEIKEKRICFECVKEDFLSREIRVEGKVLECSYCETTRETYSMDEMSERIEAVFNQHYFRTYDEPTEFESVMSRDHEFAYQWDRDGEEVVNVIESVAEISEAAASDIQQILEDKYADFNTDAIGEETDYSGGARYIEKGIDDSNWQVEWQQLEKSLKTQSRFFNSSAAKHLAKIFDGLNTLKGLGGRSLIVEAGPDTPLSAFYRARVFQTDESLKEALKNTDYHIGPPPSVHASAGRMNARGISVFYGANDPKVALAEIRPPVGSQVVIARFEITRPIRLLDLTAFEKIKVKGSVFDPIFGHRLEQAMFLGNLSSRITKPVMPDDEAVDYLATQAIADFLANDAAMDIDGIIFPSVQADGKALNVVLFHKAAKVATEEFPAGTEVDAWLGMTTEDGWEADYNIAVRIPPAEAALEKGSASAAIEQFGLYDLDNSDDFPDHRVTTLKIDLTSLKLHIIRAVEFTTNDHTIHHNRWVNRERKYK